MAPYSTLNEFLQENQFTAKFTPQIHSPNYNLGFQPQYTILPNIQENRSTQVKNYATFPAMNYASTITTNSAATTTNNNNNNFTYQLATPTHAKELVYALKNKKQDAVQQNPTKQGEQSFMYTQTPRVNYEQKRS